MKKALLAFTQIIDLYDSTKGDPDTAEYQESVDSLKEKYVNFKNEKLASIIDAMKKVTMITGQKIDREGYSPTRS